MAEYRGLQDIKTWESKDEHKYQKLKHPYKGLLPTMAITTPQLKRMTEVILQEQIIE